MPAIRPIKREPRSTDDLMASMERIIHNAVGTMAAPNYVPLGFTTPATAGIPVGPRLGGGVVSPMVNHNVDRTPNGTSEPGEY